MSSVNFKASLAKVLLTAFADGRATVNRHSSSAGGLSSFLFGNFVMGESIHVSASLSIPDSEIRPMDCSVVIITLCIRHAGRQADQKPSSLGLAVLDGIQLKNNMSSHAQPCALPRHFFTFIPRRFLNATFCPGVGLMSTISNTPPAQRHTRPYPVSAGCPLGVVLSVGTG